MSVETPEPLTAKSTSGTASESGFLDLSEEALDALIERLEQARTHALALSSDDYQLLLSAVMTLASMQEKLSHDDLTIRKMRRMLGIVRSSEKLDNLFPKSVADGADPPWGTDSQEEGAENPSGTGSPNKGSGKRQGSRRKNRNKNKPPRTPPTVHHHPITELCKGDHCPGCHAGRVYKYVPGQLLRRCVP